ncbi:hypothetical protein RJD39_12785 [Vibrio scophthalmi]|uniref:Uncharacterized protein n=1 Tax=Vibrio scophthalmi TaxID=45658 RepID=A0A1E3WS72_9VIBR|nr:hypothetical protein [Vibrio scophthalmi]ODS05214.1 hypothetical protein VSF3289_04355 [Vibrio scophthalmi]ODS10347.1 hypothetical protein VSF3289_00602 [Vibrio scophthalmi]ODS12583.1 hypothetical protein VSF3289_02908 [Vibrio scophthalmi]
MAQESNWWDGFTDGLGEFGSDLIGGAGSYFDSETAKANADKAANENATLSQQARIDELRKQEAQAQQNNQTQKMMMFGLGGFALLIVLVLIFKK